MNKLLCDVKTYLSLTADETSEDEKLNIIIEDGKQHLRQTAPDLSETDFQRSTAARYLLFNFCRYAHSNASEMFDINYKSDLLRLRLEYEVRAGVKEDEDQNTD